MIFAARHREIGGGFFVGGHGDGEEEKGRQGLLMRYFFVNPASIAYSKLKDELVYIAVESGMTQTEVAERVGTSPSRAHQRYHRFRKRIKVYRPRFRVLNGIQDPDDPQQSYKGHWIGSSRISLAQE